MNSRDEDVLPLSRVKDKSEVEILKIYGGRNVIRRLANLGMIPGARIVKVQGAPFRGPIQVKLHGSCLALGRGIADKILVKILDEKVVDGIDASAAEGKAVFDEVHLGPA